MILHEYKLIYSHIPKTGGQSIELFFLEQLGKTWKDRDYVYKNGNKERKLVAHYTIEDYKKHPELSKEQYNSYFKFTLVRNPYDRFLSMYVYLNKLERKNTSLENFINTFDKRLKDMNYFTRPQSEFTKGADYIGKYENINDDFKKLCNRVGVKGVLPYRNKALVDKPSLSKAQKKVIENIYKEDFELFYKEYD